MKHFRLLENKSESSRNHWVIDCRCQSTNSWSWIADGKYPWRLWLKIRWRCCPLRVHRWNSSWSKRSNRLRVQLAHREVFLLGFESRSYENVFAKTYRWFHSHFHCYSSFSSSVLDSIMQRCHWSSGFLHWQKNNSLPNGQTSILEDLQKLTDNFYALLKRTLL